MKGSKITAAHGEALWPARQAEETEAGAPDLVQAAPTPSIVVQKEDVALWPASHTVQQATDRSLAAASSNGPIQVVNLSASVEAMPESDGTVPPGEWAANQFLPDTLGNRQAVAHQHGLLWGHVSGHNRHSIGDAIRHHRPVLKMVCIKAYLEALTGSRPQGHKKVHQFIEQFVFSMLFVDLQPYEKRGVGLVKQCLKKKALVALADAFCQSQGTAANAKQKKHVSKPFAEMWEFLKSETLKQCGLSVSSSPSH